MLLDSLRQCAAPGEAVMNLDGLNSSTMSLDQLSSTTAVNLKVSKELQQQANRSLERVEKYLQLSWFFTSPFGFCEAVGPPSLRYYPPEQHQYDEDCWLESPCDYYLTEWALEVADYSKERAAHYVTGLEPSLLPRNKLQVSISSFTASSYYLLIDRPKASTCKKTSLFYVHACTQVQVSSQTCICITWRERRVLRYQVHYAVAVSSSCHLFLSLCFSFV